jgi:hypothetical protein
LGTPSGYPDGGLPAIIEKNSIPSKGVVLAMAQLELELPGLISINAVVLASTKENKVGVDVALS